MASNPNKLPFCSKIFKFCLILSQTQLASISSCSLKFVSSVTETKSLICKKHWWLYRKLKFGLAVRFQQVASKPEQKHNLGGEVLEEIQMIILSSCLLPLRFHSCKELGFFLCSALQSFTSGLSQPFQVIRRLCLFCHTCHCILNCLNRI